MKVTMLYFFNDIIVNIALIVMISLVLYTVKIKQFIKEDKADVLFSDHTGDSPLTPLQSLVLGIFIGILLFFVTHNTIHLPIKGMLPMDVRYLLIFYIVYYGSPMIGLISILTLNMTKVIQYLSIRDSLIIYINNTILMFILLLIATIIYKRKVPPKRASLIYLGLMLLFRIISFDLLNEVDWSYYITRVRYLHLLVFIVTLSGLFLFASWLINQFITISQRINVYQKEAIHDPLTSLYTKESFHFFLNHAHDDLIHEKKPLAMAIIDIDSFKEINDQYGHLAGDGALKHVSSLFLDLETEKKNIRFCRIGGDEFGVIFYSDIGESYDYLEQKINFISHSPFIYNEQKIDITLSCGLIMIYRKSEQSEVPSVDDLFILADEALYQSKLEGKNKLSVNRVYLN